MGLRIFVGLFLGMVLGMAISVLVLGFNHPALLDLTHALVPVGPDHAIRILADGLGVGLVIMATVVGGLIGAAAVHDR